MKKTMILIAMIVIISSANPIYASDYQGEENRGSVFQVLGDLITGNYKVDGQPIKEKGWFQVSADETKKLKFSGKEERAESQ